jgi:hypothetical protein
MENIDPRTDLHRWMMKNQSLTPRPYQNSLCSPPAAAADRPRNAVTDAMWCCHIFTGANLSHIALLPLPPTCQPLTESSIADEPAPHTLDHNYVMQFSSLRLIESLDLNETASSQNDLPEDVIVPNSGLGVFDGSLAETQVSSPQPESDLEATGYETADDSLQRLNRLQERMADEWVVMIRSFHSGSPNAEAFPLPPSSSSSSSSSDPLHTQQHDKDTSSDGDSDSSGELIPVSNNDALLPAPLLCQLEEEQGRTPLTEEDVSKRNKQIMDSWGLLDAVLGSEDNAEDSPMLSLPLSLDRFSSHIAAGV